MQLKFCVNCLYYEGKNPLLTINNLNQTLLVYRNDQYENTTIGLGYYCLTTISHNLQIYLRWSWKGKSILLQ